MSLGIVLDKIIGTDKLLLTPLYVNVEGFRSSYVSLTAIKKAFISAGFVIFILVNNLLGRWVHNMARASWLLFGVCNNKR